MKALPNTFVICSAGLGLLCSASAAPALGDSLSLNDMGNPASPLNPANTASMHYQWAHNQANPFSFEHFASQPAYPYGGGPTLFDLIGGGRGAGQPEPAGYLDAAAPVDPYASAPRTHHRLQKRHVRSK